MLTNELKAKLDNYISQLEEANPQYGFSYTIGKKYIRVVENFWGQEAVWCFVDAYGNLYKAEGWNRPARGIRGHLDHPILNLGGFYAR